MARRTLPSPTPELSCAWAQGWRLSKAHQQKWPFLFDLAGGNLFVFPFSPLISLFRGRGKKPSLCHLFALPVAFCNEWVGEQQLPGLPGLSGAMRHLCVFSLRLGSVCSLGGGRKETQTLPLASKWEVSVPRAAGGSS